MRFLNKIMVFLLIFGQFNTSWSEEFHKSKIALKPNNSSLSNFVHRLKKSLNPYVNVGKVSLPSDSSKTFLILFQDLHCNYEAQLNIAKALEVVAGHQSPVTSKNNSLVTGDRRLETGDSFLILTEGADGPEDTSFLGKFPSKEVREEASKKFMKEGKMTGAEFLSIARYGEIPIQIEGVEDADLYIENLKAFQEVMGKRQQTDVFIEAAEGLMEEIKEKTFSQKLLELNVKENEFKENKIKLEEYANYLKDKYVGSFGASLQSLDVAIGGDFTEAIFFLNDIATRLSENSIIPLPRWEGDLRFPPHPASPTRGDGTFQTACRNDYFIRKEYPNLSIFLGLISQQKKVSFEKVEQEKNKVTEQLAKKLPKEELSFLIQQSLKLKLGKVSQEDYFLNLEGLIEKNMNLREYPHLITYIGIVKKQSELNHALLLDEIHALSEKLKQDLAMTESEKNLLVLDQRINILKRMFRLEMTREDRKFVKEHRQIYQVENIIEQLEKYALQCKFILPEAFNSPEQIQELSNIFRASENFYDLALKRDRVMAAKALKALGSRVTSRQSPEIQSSNKNDIFVRPETGDWRQATVLITGGFHSEGITKILKEAGAGFVVLTPKVNQSHDIKNYLSLMVDQRIRVMALDFFHVFGRKLAERFPVMSNNLLREVISDFLELGKQYHIEPSKLHAWVDQIEGLDVNILAELRSMIDAKRSSKKFLQWEIIPETVDALILRFNLMTGGLTVDVLKELSEKGVVTKHLYEEAESRFLKRQNPVIKNGLSALADIVYLDLLYAKERGMVQDEMMTLAYQSAQARINAFSKFGKWARDHENIVNPYQYAVFRQVIDVIDELEAHRDDYAQIIREYFEEFFKEKGVNGLVGTTTLYQGIARAPLMGKSGFRDWEKADEKVRGRRKLHSRTISKGPLNIERDEDIPANTNPVLSTSYMGYSIEVKKQVNPDDRPLVALYGGAGADISSFLLSTNATMSYFVEEGPVDPPELNRFIKEAWENISLNDGYTHRKKFRGFGGSLDLNSESLAYRIAQELKAMGVDPKTVHISVQEREIRGDLSHRRQEKKYVKIEFDWTYPGREVPQKYSITYIPESVFRIATYFPGAESSLLDKVLERGIDIYYQRAGVDITNFYSDLMPVLGKVLRPGGCVVSDNCKNERVNDFKSGIVDPKPFLERNGDKFEVVPASLLMDWWTVIMPTSGSYGSKMNILRKQPLPAHKVTVEDFLRIFEKRVLDSQRPIAIDVLENLIQDFLIFSRWEVFYFSSLSNWLDQWMVERQKRSPISETEQEKIDHLKVNLLFAKHHTGDNKKLLSRRVFNDWIKKIFVSSLVVLEEALEDASREDLSYLSFLRKVRREKNSRISQGLSALTDFVWMDLKWAEVACGHRLMGNELTQAAQEFVTYRIQGLINLADDFQKTALGFMDAPPTELQGLNDILQIVEYIKSHREECVHAVVTYLNEAYTRDDGNTPDLNSMSRKHLYGVSGAQDWKDWKKVLEDKSPVPSSRNQNRFLKSEEVNVPSYAILSRPHVGYAMAVKRMINPDNRDLTAIYGAAGADISSFLLSTNATTGYFIDPVTPDVEELKKMIINEAEWETISLNDNYVNSKREKGFGNAIYLTDGKSMALRLVQELKALGVERTSIKLVSDARGYFHISFDWIYPGTNQKKRYSVTYIPRSVETIGEADENKQDSLITEILKKGTDIYYQRAGMGIPYLYGNFMPTVSLALRMGGYLITNDDDHTNPLRDQLGLGPVLEGDLEKQYPSLAMKWWELLIPSEMAYGWKMSIHRKGLSSDYHMPRIEGVLDRNIVDRAA